ncbi:MAG: PfkB family carbohydrate kinase [Promethearchaeota archaeon]
MGSDENNLEYSAMNEYDVTNRAVASLKQKYPGLKDVIKEKTVFLGFDGYIDSLYSLVRIREDATHFTPMESMKEFADRILEAAGSSCNIERVLKKEIAGGFGPNTGRAISHLGASVILVGAFGYPHLHNEFKEYPKNVKLYSVQNYGRTAGFEFNDGKVMTTYFGPINELTWDLILSRLPRDQLIDLIEKSNAIGQGHWALVPNMSSYWQHFIEDIFPSISNIKDKLFMVDVADLKKRKHADINNMIKLLQKIEDFMPTVLSMNDRETKDISEVITAEDSEFKSEHLKPIKNRDDYIEFNKNLNDVLGLSYIVTHDPHFATITTKTGHFWVTEGYTSTPRFTTAAGDHFNGGVMLGLTLGLKPEEAITLGNAYTAAFVRTGISANFDQLYNFIQKYIYYILNDDPDFEM